MSYDIVDRLFESLPDANGRHLDWWLDHEGFCSGATAPRWDADAVLVAIACAVADEPGLVDRSTSWYDVARAGGWPW